jgi:hypothetical protein
MNIFHEASIDQSFTDAFSLLALVSVGVILLSTVLSIFVDRRKTGMSKPFFIINCAAGALAVVGLLGMVSNTLIQLKHSNTETVSSLQSWSQNNYGIKLSKDNAQALVGIEERSKAVAVDYKGEPTVVQLVEYKDGYILVNNKNQVVLPQK